MFYPVAPFLSKTSPFKHVKQKVPAHMGISFFNFTYQKKKKLLYCPAYKGPPECQFLGGYWDTHLLSKPNPKSANPLQKHFVV